MRQVRRALGALMLVVALVVPASAEAAGWLAPEPFAHVGFAEEGDAGSGVLRVFSWAPGATTPTTDRVADLPPSRKTRR